jgi:hypothetical protein
MDTPGSNGESTATGDENHGSFPVQASLTSSCPIDFSLLHNATDANWPLTIEDVEHLLIEAPVAPEDISAPPPINVVE